MHPELEKLLDLQVKDLSLVEVDQRLKAITTETARLDGALAGAQAEIAAAAKRLADGIKRREEMELRIESYRTIQDRRRQRLELARGAREAQALMTEVEMARTVLVKEEGEWIKAAEGTQDAEQTLKAAEERHAALKLDQESERARLAEEAERLAGDRGAAKAIREQSAAQVERVLRARYDRLRGGRPAAMVVVALRGDACGACHTSVPRNRRTQIRAGVLLDSCEGCGVILYSAEP